MWRKSRFLKHSIARPGFCGFKHAHDLEVAKSANSLPNVIETRKQHSALDGRSLSSEHLENEARLQEAKQCMTRAAASSVPATSGAGYYSTLVGEPQPSFEQTFNIIWRKLSAFQGKTFCYTSIRLINTGTLQLEEPLIKACQDTFRDPDKIGA